MTNLIQNYVNNVPAKKPDFDINREINKNTLVKPLPGRGKLVNGCILNSPVLAVKNIGYDAKAFKHAMNGKANDHELGRLNNVGLLTGGLGIAGYLFTKRQTPMTKGMEFIGLGSFLASMALWPKIAIQLPAYLIHGVNVHKQYQDSFGRRKPFYQDPQFIPWDLYSDKQINKIGDRLHVDKDIPNRRDFIQEKMRKIAVQNNTLWMLTAGFAAPIMSSLICNQAEPYMLKYVNNKRNKEADDILKNFGEYTKKNPHKDALTNIEKIFGLHKNAPVDENLREILIEAFTGDLDLVTAQSFRDDFNRLVPSNTFKVDNKTAGEISKNLKNAFSDQGFSEDFLKALLKDENWISETLLSHNQLNRTVDETIDFTEIKTILTDAIKKNFDEYFKANPNAEKEDWGYIKTLILNQNEGEHPIKAAIKKVPGATLDAELQTKLRKIAIEFDKFTTKNNALNRYAALKVAAAPETVAANYWNDISKELLNTLGFTPKEIEKVRLDDSMLAPLLRDKIETITSDKSAYNKVVKTIIEKVSALDKLVNSKDMKSHILNGEEYLSFEEKQGLRTGYEKKVDEVYDSFSSILRSEGFGKTAKALTGIDAADTVGTAKNIQKAFVEERLLGIKSSFYRLINTFDFFRRVSTDANNIPGIKGQYREIKEELIELCKFLTLDGHSSDYANKFFMQRNPNPSTDTSDVVVKKGKVDNKYLGKVQGVDIAEDKYFYQQGMEAMYKCDMHPDTKALINKTSLEKEFINYRKLMIERIGGENNFKKPRHKISAPNQTGSDIKFLLTGISPREFFYNNLKQSFNTKKWMKTFAPAGIALLGATILAQFFFGKMKNPKKAGKHD